MAESQKECIITTIILIFFATNGNELLINTILAD